MSDRLYQQLSWQIGDVSITRLVEVVLTAPLDSLFPGRTADELAPYASWMQPNFLSADGNMFLSIHAFLIRAGGLKMIVDTCAGNGKDLPLFPEWNNMNTPFLENMTKLGFAPESIDRVMCTHLHFDHVGWNTRPVDGKWVPTFANARYLFNRREWAAWEHSDNPPDKATMPQNVVPIIEAGQLQWVDNHWAIDDQVELLPTPGHTPGHCSVRIAHQGASAVITGDMMIHPVQIAEPGWQQTADTDKAQAARTRQAFVDDHCDRDVMILGTHFNTPTGVYIVERKGARRVRLADN
jgi:glyoxylase-like metal-dependent hydrolase (beta-lactamase superfamily II)